MIREAIVVRLKPHVYIHTPYLHFIWGTTRQKRDDNVLDISIY